MTTEAVFIDALGTMLWLEPPWERIDPEAVEGIAPERVKDAFIAEIAYYMPRSGEGRDAESLADLRRRCAGVLSREMGREIEVETMVGALAFQPFEDAAPTLAALRERGLTLICVSNWDCSLGNVLADLGLAESLDGVVTSAAAGARKPDAAIFAPALKLAGCEPEQAIHVGDTADDVTAAQAAGIEPLLINRSAAVTPSAAAAAEQRLRGRPTGGPGEAGPSSAAAAAEQRLRGRPTGGPGEAGPSSAAAAAEQRLRGEIASLAEIVEHLRP